jgi:hypothetical protein
MRLIIERKNRIKLITMLAGAEPGFRYRGARIIDCPETIYGTTVKS